MPLFVNAIARNLRRPERNLWGSFVTRILKTHNSFLEEQAVSLCEVAPNHCVLEVGFGPGVGIKKATKQIKKGEGRVHGVDMSPAMVIEAISNLTQEIDDDLVELTLGNASHLPYRNDFMDRIYHTNCYYFWPDTEATARELYRVLKPGGFMVTLLNLERVKESAARGYLKNEKWEPEPYMDALRAVGFTNVGMESKEGGGLTYECILAHKAE